MKNQRKRFIWKNENGSVTLFALIAMMFFTSFLIGAYVNNNNKNTAQLKEIEEIQAEYIKESTSIDDTYQEVIDGISQYVNVTFRTEKTDEVYNIDSWTNQSLKMTIKFPEEGLTKEQKDCVYIDGQKVDYQKQVDLKGYYLIENNCKIEIRLNRKTKKVIISKIDKENPNAGTLLMKLNNNTGANYTNNTWTNKDVYIEAVHGTDGQSGHKETTYSINGGEQLKDPQTLTEEGTYTIIVTTTDNVGNTSTRSGYTIKIDKTAPTSGTLTMKLNNSTGKDYINDTWTKEDVYLALNNGDDVWNGAEKTSGHLSTTYRIGAVGKEITEPGPIIATGEHVVTVTTTDKAGNISTKTYTIKIDKDKPTNLTITSKLNTEDGANYTPGTWTNQNVFVKLAAKDNVKIDKYEWYESNAWTDRALTTSTDANPVGKITYTAERNQVLRFRAQDTVGNISDEATLDVRIDKTSPTVGTPTVTATATTIKLDVAGATDSASGIKEYEFYLDGTKKATQSGSSYTFTGLSPNKPYTLKYIVRDNAGNIVTSSNTSKITLANIPTALTATKDSTAQGQQITVNWNANSNSPATIYELQASSDNSTWETVYTGTALSYVHTGLQLPNSNGGSTVTKYYKVRAKNTDNIYTVYTSSVSGNTLMSPVVTKTLTSSGVNTGLNKITLSWSAIPGATQYGISIFDGYTYRYHDLGNVTSWDSDIAKIYPTSSQIGSWNGRTDPFRWSGDGQSWKASSNELYVKANSSYTAFSYYQWIHIYSKDSSGRYSGLVWSGATSKCDNTIDTDAPNNFTLNAGTTTTNSITVTGSTTDTYMTDNYPGSGIRGYKFGIYNNGTWEWSAEQAGTSYTFTGLKDKTSYKTKMIAYDNKGNYVETSEVTGTTQELKAGTLTMKLNNASGANYTSDSWTKENVYVTKNDGNGTTSYETTSGSAQTIAVGTTAATTVTTQGTTTIRVKTTDGTNTVYSSNYVIKIDKTAPTAGTMNMKLESSTGANYSNDTWTNHSVYLSVNNGSDALSGHKTTTYTVNGGTPTSDAQTLTTTGTYIIEVTTTDNATNSSTRTYTVKIDKDKPTGLTVTAKLNSSTGAAYNSGWTNQNVYVTLTSRDNVGIGQYQWYTNGAWSTDSLTTSSGTGTITFTANRNETVRFRVVDTVGNISDEGTLIVKIDKTSPLTVAPTANSTTNSITVTNKQTDSDSGINTGTIQYALKTGTTWGTWQTGNVFNNLTHKTTYAVKTKVTDNAGNEGESLETTIATTELTVGSLTFRKDSSSGIVFTPRTDVSGTKVWINNNVYIAQTNGNAGTTSYQVKNSAGTAQTLTSGLLTTTTDTYTVVVTTTDGTNSVTKTYYLDVDKTNPVNTAPTATSTTNSITVTFKQTDAHSGLNNGTVQYSLKTGSTWGAWQTSNVFSNLTHKTTYAVKTRVTDNAGNTGESLETSIITTELTVGSLTFRKDSSSGTVFTPRTDSSGAKVWINNNVHITQTNGNAGTTAYQVTNSSGTVQTLTSGLLTTTTDIYTVTVGTTDGTNTVTKTYYLDIDKTAPVNTAPTATSTTNSITVTFKQTDVHSGLNIGTVQYALKTGSTWGAWQTSNVFSGLTHKTTYAVKTKVTDNAGNEGESSEFTIITKELTVGSLTFRKDSSSGTVFTPRTDSSGAKVWINNNVHITQTNGNAGTTAYQVTNSSGTVQTLTSGLLTTTTDIYTVTVGTTDGTNTVTKTYYLDIDKTAPVNTAPTATSTTNSITVTFKQTDVHSGLNIGTVQYALKTGSTWGAWQTSNVFSGLTHKTTYAVKTKVTDNAGNEGESSEFTIITKELTVGSLTFRKDSSSGTVFTPRTDSSGAKVWINNNVHITQTNGNAGTTAYQVTNSSGTVQTLTSGLLTTTTDIYTVTVGTTDGTNTVTKTYYLDIDKTAPVNTAPTATSTTNSITVTFKQTDVHSGLNIGTVQYALKTGSTWGAWQTSNVFSGLTHKTTYAVKTKVTDNAGNEGESSEFTIITKELTVGSLTFRKDSSSGTVFTPRTDSSGAKVWINNNVHITQTNGNAGTTAYQVTNSSGTVQTLTSGLLTTTTDIYTVTVGTTDGTNTVTKTYYLDIDKTAPVNTAPTATSTTNSITVTFKQTDVHSGLNIGTVQYALKTGSTWGAWQTSNVFSGLTHKTTYAVKTKVTDNAGNEGESSEFTIITKELTVGSLTFRKDSSSGTVFTPRTDSSGAKVWINNNVHITQTNGNAGTTAYQVTNSSGTVQTLTSGLLTTTTDIYTVTVGTTDGTNTVTKTYYLDIDKTAPVNTAPTATSTTNSITVTFKQTDVHSGLNIGTVQYALKTGSTWGAWQTSNVFSGLTHKTTYAVKTKVTDNAGNEGESSEFTIITKELTVGSLTFRKDSSSGTVFTPRTDSSGAKVWINNNVHITQTNGNAGTTAYQVTNSSGTVQTLTSGLLTTTTDIYTVTVGTTDGTNTVTKTYYLDVDKTNPTTTKPTAVSVTSAIVVTCNQTDALSGANDATVKYALKTGTTWGAWQSSNTFTGLTHNTTYAVKTKITDNAGNEGESSETSIKTQQLVAGTLTMKLGTSSGSAYTTDTWTNQSVYVTKNDGTPTTANNGGITVTTSYESITGSAQTVAAGTTGATTISTTGTTGLRVKTTDGTNTVYSSNYIIKVDKAAPTTTKPTAVSVTSAIVVICNQTDALSGANYATVKYALKTGTTWGAWQSSNTFTGLTHNTTYAVKTKITDNAGNEGESSETSIKTQQLVAGTLTMKLGTSSGSAYTTDTWTNQSVYVTKNDGTPTTANNGSITVTTSYESITGSAQKVAAGTTGATTISTTGTTTLRVKTTDGTNTVYSSYYIIKIDKTAPTIGSLSVTSATAATTWGIKASTVADNTGGSGLKGYYASTSSTKPTASSNWTTSTTTSFTYTGALQSKTYYVWVIDNAGNISSAKSITTEAINYSVGNGTTATSWYTTLSDAIAGASASNTIKVLNNITDSSTATISKNLTLNLNGNTLTRTAKITVNSGITFNITGTGTLTTSTASLNLIENTGTLNLNLTGTISNGVTSDGTQSVILNNTSGTVNFYSGTMNCNLVKGITNSGKFNMTGGTMKGTGANGVISNSGTTTISEGTLDYTSSAYDSVLLSNTNTTIISGGTFTSNRRAILNDTSGTLTISGGNITSSQTVVSGTNEYPGIIGNIGVFNFSGGTLKATGNHAALWTRNSANLTGGTISSTSSYAVINSERGTLDIGGGTKKITITSEGAVANDDQWWDNPTILNGSEGITNIWNNIEITHKNNGIAVTNFGGKVNYMGGANDVITGSIWNHQQDNLETNTLLAGTGLVVQSLTNRDTVIADKGGLVVIDGSRIRSSGSLAGDHTALWIKQGAVGKMIKGTLWNTNDGYCIYNEGTWTYSAGTLNGLQYGT